jgi:hypothetical protein
VSVIAILVALVAVVAEVAEVAEVAVEALPVRAPTKVVDVTDDNPAMVVADDPNDIAVEPTVTLLFVNCAFPIPDSVPPRVIVPVDVIVPPVNVIPDTVPAVAIEVTVPVPPTTFVAHDAVPNKEPVTPLVTVREFNEASEPLVMTFFHAGILYVYYDWLQNRVCPLPFQVYNIFTINM